MTVVLLSLASAALFGAMTVGVRIGMRGLPNADGVPLATVLPALAVVLVAATVRHDVHGAWPFLLAGVLAPGGSQVLFTLAVREIGASRVSVTVGAAPLVAVAIALIFLGEPLRLVLVAGALAVVAGGVLLAAERDRPGHLRGRGLLYAAGAAILFATRDNVVRALHGHATPETAAAATLLSGALLAGVWARRLPTRRELARLSLPGVCFGLSYVCVFEAYWRGRVTIVSPLVATESLWGVALAYLLVRQTEGVGRRLAFGAALVVAGGALIGAVR
ncbi:MAG TPA: DMT family transporter [Gaiellaceae bacterium]|jgi:drug/metabolite transporter (DMT)-like permease